MAFRYIHRLVGEFQEPNTATVKHHEHELRYDCLRFYNKLVGALRDGSFNRLSFTDAVLEESNLIEETTLMRGKVERSASMYKTQLRRFYFEESEGYMHDYRLPNKAKTFKQFIKKNNQVKQCACEIVTAM